jgi:hypothetical protein
VVEHHGTAREVEVFAANVTMPAAGACTDAPIGAAMSRP